jgi:hypothetical protein
MRSISTLVFAVGVSGLIGCAGTNTRTSPAIPPATVKAPQTHPVRSWFQDTFRLGHHWGKKTKETGPESRTVITPQFGTPTADGVESELVLPSEVKN